MRRVLDFEACEGRVLCNAADTFGAVAGTVGAILVGSSPLAPTSTISYSADGSMTVTSPDGSVDDVMEMDFPVLSSPLPLQGSGPVGGIYE